MNLPNDILAINIIKDCVWDSRSNEEITNLLANLSPTLNNFYKKWLYGRKDTDEDIIVACAQVLKEM